ncbi:hypothetical protein RSOLAG22IIIB_05811 [Rhizoctonia solani]|uniref:Uncharacterized protein n=1 Tax=Rhizoctonia solani TaxID=456999 RepID=A0A0K6GA63_9AGAM|nr:hypothetical protein RSOLAG22IIIB_05811 [Rhizoctonia solani]
MSDLSYSPEPVSKSRKRKSASSSATRATKKPRAKKSPPDPYQTAKDYVESALADPQSFYLPDDYQEIRDMISTITQYTKSLEGSVAVANQTGRDAPTLKTAQQIQEEASTIKGVIHRGIKKLMIWRSTCTEGRAKFAFEGVCTDPRVFGAVFGLDGPPVWANKRYTCAEFEEFVGEIRGEVRYAYLYLSKNVTVRYNSETGEFTATGTYGKRV